MLPAERPCGAAGGTVALIGTTAPEAVMFDTGSIITRAEAARCLADGVGLGRGAAAWGAALGAALGAAALGAALGAAAWGAAGVLDVTGAAGGTAAGPAADAPPPGPAKSSAT